MTSSRVVTAARRIHAGGWRDAVLQGTAMWLLARLVVMLIGAVTLSVRSGPSLTDRAGARIPDGVGAGILSLLHHWDSGYFLDIAMRGYFHQDAFVGLPGFFPGYPLLARGVAEGLSGGDPTPSHIVAGLWMVSLVSSWIAAVLIFRTAVVVSEIRIARLATVLFVAGPYSVFLYANYSESLFLALACSSWYAAMRQRWLWAGVWCGFAGLTRINGVFLVLALITWYVLSCRREGRRIVRLSALAIVPAVAGIAAYFGYLWLQTGRMLAWSAAQTDGWGREFRWPWQAFYQTAGRVLFASTLDRRLQFGSDILVCASIVGCIVLWARRRDWPAVVLAAATLLALTTSFTFVSLARNSITIFPIVLILAELLSRQRRRWAVIGVHAAWVGVFLLNTALFTAGYWAD